MLIMWAIAMDAKSAKSKTALLAHRDDYAEVGETILREHLQLFETENEGIQALAEFRATYNERERVPRSGLVRGTPEEWRLWRVEYHEHAEQVEI